MKLTDLLLKQTKKVAVLSRISRPIHSYAAVWQIAPHKPKEYAANMYNFLARLDKSGCDLIVVELCQIIQNG